MHRTATYGVVGGYGATGSEVVSELCRSTIEPILIGGRNLEKATALASNFPGRASATRVDVLDDASLNDFCRRCAIIVNTAGPVMGLQDRVAQAAFRHGCHYVDPAGLLTVTERMLPHDSEIRSLGLSFVSSAGWLPGITEIVPRYAYVAAKAKMDTLESLTIYFGDNGEWTMNAYQEAVWLLRQKRSQRPGYFRNGEWITVGMLKAGTTVGLGGRIGTRRYYPFCIPELAELGAQLTDCTLSAYAHLPGMGAALTGVAVAWLPMPGTLGARLLRNALRKHSLPVGGFLMAQACGHHEGKKSRFTVQVTYEDGRGYWLNGVVPATVARMIPEANCVKAGVRFLADAVDPIRFVAELQGAGVGFEEQVGGPDEKQGE